MGNSSTAHSYSLTQNWIRGNEQDASQGGDSIIQADASGVRYWTAPLLEGTVVEAGSETITIPGLSSNVNWIVILKSPAVITQMNDSFTGPAAARQKVRAEQVKFIAALKEQNLVYSVHREYEVLLNGVAIAATPRQVEAIRKRSDVVGVFPDYQLSVALGTSVPLIGAPVVWDMLDGSGQNVTGQGIRVAVIDTGIDYTHTAFGGCTAVNSGGACRVVGGYDFVNDDADPMDDNLHGTHVAGIIGANDINIKGVAPDVTLYAYKVCNALGQCDTSDVIAAP